MALSTWSARSTRWSVAGKSVAFEICGIGLLSFGKSCTQPDYSAAKYHSLTGEQCAYIFYITPVIVDKICGGDDDS